MPLADSLRTAPALHDADCTTPAARSCHECGQAQRLPALPAGSAARCWRCGALLRRTWADPLRLALALNLGCLLLFAAGATNVLAVVQAEGRTRTAGLFSGPAALAQNGVWPLGALVFATTVLAPLLVAGLSVYVLGGVRLQRPPPGLARAFAWRNRLRPWSMIEVFLVGYFVAYTKLGVLAQIEAGWGLLALFGFMVATIAGDAVLDPQAVWEAIARHAPARAAPAADPAPARVPIPLADLICCGTCELACRPAGSDAHRCPDARRGPDARCPRCGGALHRRKPDSLARTAALTLSALVFYVPANVFPVLTVIQTGRGSPSTILSGVWELAVDGDWSLAVIVFGASVAVPVLKILGLGAMLLIVLRRQPGQPHRPGRQHSHRDRYLRQATALYRVIAVIGRWSMIDVFMESILSALVQFGSVAQVTTEPGALAFAATVLLTIFAAEGFDPRLMWDAPSR